jgi:hypothetical protein
MGFLYEEVAVSDGYGSPDDVIPSGYLTDMKGSIFLMAHLPTIR